MAEDLTSEQQILAMNRSELRANLLAGSTRSRVAVPQNAR